MTDARRQILVVERDPALGRELVEQLLADGYLAELAQNAGRATAAASTRVPKLVVLGELEQPRQRANAGSSTCAASATGCAEPLAGERHPTATRPTSRKPK